MLGSETTTEEILKLLKEIAEEQIPFNKVLGLTIQTMDEEHMQVKFDMWVFQTKLRGV